MKKRFRSSTFSALGAVLIFGVAAHGALISESDIIANWNPAASVTLGGSDAAWSHVGDAIQVGNARGSLISDFSSNGDFSFSTKIKPVGMDNDVIGIIFGFQDTANTYALTWGKDGSRGGGVFKGIDLSKFSSPGGVAGRTLLAEKSNSFWTAGATYLFSVSRVGSDIIASIDEGATNKFSATVTDTTYMHGALGFESWSQRASFSIGSTNYTDLSEPPQEIQAVSVNSGTTVLLLSATLAGLIWIRRKARLS